MKSYVRKDGYRTVYVGCVNGKTILVLEHRLVIEAMLGRKLKRDEIVHHIDGDKLNNSPSNLEVMTKHAHNHEHHPWEVRISQVSHVCEYCGTKYDVQTYRDATAKYCSTPCRLAGLHEGLRVVRPSTPCVICGVMIEDQTRYTKKYCGESCRAVGRGQSVSQARQRKVS